MEAVAVGATDVAGETTGQFAIRGMTCSGCAEHVRTALVALPGVRSARVDLAAATATVQYDPAVLPCERLKQAVAGAGYVLEMASPAARAAHLPLRPIVVGLLGTLGMLGFYLGVVTVAQGWDHALELLVTDRWFVGPIAVGFGTQMGLFTHLRMLHARTAVGGVAVSSGTSTVGMLACCAHHVTDVLPILGLSGAAIFLDLYKTPLLWLAIAMNLAGIAYFVHRIRQHLRMACHTSAVGLVGLEGRRD